MDTRADTLRRRFLRGAIAELDKRLRDRGTQLHVRIGRDYPAPMVNYGKQRILTMDLYKSSCTLVL